MGGVQYAVDRGRVTADTRSTFQAVALLVRELRAQAKSAEVAEAQRTVQLKRIDGIAAMMARTAAGNASQ